MKVSKLNAKITDLENICEPFLIAEEESFKDKEVIDNMALKVKSFDEIIKECKEEVKSADEKHMEHVLKLLYGLEIDSNSIIDTDKDLENYVSGQINAKDMEVNESRIKNLQNIISNTETIINDLILEYKNTLHVNRKWYSFQGYKLKKYEGFLKRLVNLKEKLEVRLERDSQKISASIIENFYSSYIFFSFLIHISMKHHKEILLLEIANRLDRYIEVIEPSFSGRFLHHDDLIYHYAIYELKELKSIIFKFLQ